MKCIRNLWNILRQEISQWKNEKKDLITGILYIIMIAWIFYNRPFFVICLSPFLFVWMRRQRSRRRYKDKEILRKEFREMMLSIGNSLSAGYSIENALKTARSDLMSKPVRVIGTAHRCHRFLHLCTTSLIRIPSTLLLLIIYPFYCFSSRYGDCSPYPYTKPYVRY